MELSNDLVTALSSLGLAEADILKLLEITECPTDETASGGRDTNIVNFKNPDGSYNDQISLLVAQLGSLCGMSAKGLSKNLKLMCEKLTGTLSLFCLSPPR